MYGCVTLLSAGLFLLPAQSPVQDHVQPLIPPPIENKHKVVPGYDCDHPRQGYQYARMKGVGDLPADLMQGGWTCSDGCGVEYACEVVVQAPKIPASQMRYMYRKRK